MKSLAGSLWKGKNLIGIMIICIMFAGCSTTALYFSKHTIAQKIKTKVKQTFFWKQYVTVMEETSGFGHIQKVQVYENNKLITNRNIDFTKDIKKVYYSKNSQRLVNYPDGYSMDIPVDYSWTFNYSPSYIRAVKGTDEIIISKEWSPYEDVDMYISHYMHRFLTNEEYRKANNIALLEDETKQYGNNQARILKVQIKDLDATKNDCYTFVTIKTDSQLFYRFMIKEKSGAPTSGQILNTLVPSFRYFHEKGKAEYDLDLYPVIPEKWSEETKKSYEAIRTGVDMRWGVFTKDVFNEGVDKSIPALEQKIGHKFDVVLCYRHFVHDFPTDFMKKNYEQGRMVELTYQITCTNNENLFGYTPNLDIYRGKKDQEIRKLAKAAKEFGHPFLFRLNNEMNSDWTSYSGIVNMSDPQIFIDNWRRIYRIFEEEGVDNAIWIFNPNDLSFPPCYWNDFMAYYPGNEYVQMIGATGYNNGTYYQKENGESWREFKEIYDEVQEKYQPVFGKFPWIITEFASSSVGGDKVKWMDKMFQDIYSYPQIKIAVWFSYADYDPRPGCEGKVSRPYWLDETPETLESFKKGIVRHKND